MPKQKDELDIKPLLLEAAALASRKSKDYNGGPSRDDYFPFGQYSYTQMIHTKALRLQSLTLNEEEPNFEGIRDTLLDIINYAAFNLNAIDREVV